MNSSEGGNQDPRSTTQTAQPDPPTPIPDSVAQELKQRGLDPSDPQLRLAVTVAAKYYAAPMPTAAELGSYGQIDPGLQCKSFDGLTVSAPIVCPSSVL
jgi:hypothetical protein